MRLYTIQTAEAWAQWQKTGLLRADPEWVYADFVPAYRWMMTHMSHRIGPAPEGCVFPVWAWYQWDSATRPRPDLRYGEYLTRGSSGVCVTLDVSDENVLLSDFDLWHYVLNYWYLGSSFEEQKAFDARCKRMMGHPSSDAACNNEMRASWDRIFDLDWYAEDIAEPRPLKRIQAVGWSFSLQNVQDVRPFIAR